MPKLNNPPISAADSQHHIVALSGGKDSTAMALRLSEINPGVDYQYVISPTGDEMPSMTDHLNLLSDLLGRPLVPVSSGVSLSGLIRRWGALPNRNMRWCTRVLKIEPFIAHLVTHRPAIAYVGLRADEDTREGAVYSQVDDVQQVFPLREWGWGLAEVTGYLRRRGVTIPKRTDCARCYGQQIGEWWNLWRMHPDIYASAVAEEVATGHTFRSDGRDSWPASLEELRVEFESGKVPTRSKSCAFQRELFDDTGLDARRVCRVCTL